MGTRRSPGGERADGWRKKGWGRRAVSVGVGHTTLHLADRKRVGNGRQDWRGCLALPCRVVGVYPLRDSCISPLVFSPDFLRAQGRLKRAEELGGHASSRRGCSLLIFQQGLGVVLTVRMYCTGGYQAIVCHAMQCHAMQICGGVVEVKRKIERKK